MSESPYQWSVALKRAMQRNRRDAHNRYLQLATVRCDGTPAVRSLVCRDFCATTLQLRMVTDARSGKIGDIAANAAGEICWYFTHTREQFRIRGRLEFAGPGSPEQDVRQRLWKSLSQKAREQFFWPHPARPLSLALPSLADTGEQPPDSFFMLALAPREVDHLTLRGEPQTRLLSSLDEQGLWTSEAVNP